MAKISLSPPGLAEDILEGVSFTKKHFDFGKLTGKCFGVKGALISETSQN